MRPRRLCQEDSGQAIVEMALVTSLLLMLLLGIAEVGRVTHAYLAVTHAAREGVRIAALGKSDDEVFETVRNAAAGLPSDELTVAVSPSRSQRRRGDPVTVQVDFTVQIVVPLVSDFLPNPFPVKGKAVMRVE